jgi:hypothetical protein
MSDKISVCSLFGVPIRAKIVHHSITTGTKCSTEFNAGQVRHSQDQHNIDEFAKQRIFFAFSFATETDGKHPTGPASRPFKQQFKQQANC